jgi:PKD-like domain
MSHALTRLVLASLLLCGTTQSQQPTPAANVCPTITVDCPSDLPKPGELRTFTATVTGATTTKLDYVWTVSAGTIRSGQGTPSIQVEFESYGGLTGTLTVAGLPASCTNSVSCSSSGCGLPPSAVLFDKYGKLRWTEEQMRLKLFADELRAQPGAQGYVIVSPGLNGTEQAARKVISSTRAA